ncbi:MAG TPA: HAMP domain-containing protein [Bacteroidota bacterium]|nr:HAMP domain-containing protein [Bacteroidota bacterium]
MQWYNNLKIRVKLISAFTVVALVAATIGWIGITNIHNLSESNADMYEHLTVPISELGDISTSFQRMRVDIGNLIDATTMTELAAHKEKVLARQDEIDKLATGFEKTILSQDVKDLFTEFKTDRKNFESVRDRMITLAEEGNHAAAAALWKGDAEKARTAYQSSIEKLVDIKVKQAKETSEVNAAQASSASTQMIILIIVGVVLALGIGFIISNLITKPLAKGVAMMEELSKAHLGTRLKMDRKDEIGVLADRMDVFADALQNVVVNLNMISDGDLTVEVKKLDEKDEIAPAMINILEALRALVAEAGMLTKAAVDGRLQTRGDVKKFKGGYKEIVEGVNQTLNAVIGPLNVAAEYVDRIAKGDIPPKITDSYNGDFNEIKNNLNTCIDAVNALVADAGLLSKAAVEGKLATRADASKHQGDFRKIVQGVDDCLDAVIGPLNVAAEYVDRIAKGDIPPKITDSYNGDFNEIKNNLNMCIDATMQQTNAANGIAAGDFSMKVQVRSENDVLAKSLIKTTEVLKGLQKELQRLTEASRDGLLSERGKPDQFQGAYAEVIGGVNTMLDAILLPIGEGNRVLGLIRGGDLRQKVMIECKGDHEKMKNAINGVHGWLTDLVAYVTKIANGDMSAQMAKASSDDQIHEWLMLLKSNINALVADANMLSQAAVEGKLATRADASKHQGDFRKIVQGVDDCLDAVIGPLNVAANYVDRIAKGDIPAKITDSYNGDFNTLKNNLNVCIDAVNALVADAGLLSKAAVEGKLATRADASKHQGDFRKIVQGVDDCLDAVIGPLNVAAEYVDRIAKGDIPPKITDSYNGDFNEIKNNLNTCIDAVNALVADAGLLSKAAVEGKLATRADASKHQGDFRKIVQGVDDCLDAVIGPLNVAANYVDRIAKGDIPAKITDTYNGDFNTLKNNLNVCIDAVNALVADAGLLSKAAVEGKLATRADASKHQGDFRKIVQGVDDCLDAVIGPLNVAAEYVDRIAKGDIPPKITDSYNGDFNEIKNNLNQCIDATMQQTNAANGIAAGDFSMKVQVRSENDVLAKSLIKTTEVLKGLQKELQRLTEASRDGLLSERGKPDQFQGAYAEVIGGVNTMLDAILLPIGEGNRVLGLIRGGDLRQKVMIECKGDHEKMKNAINGVHGWLTDLVAYVTKIANGDMSAQMAKASSDDQIHEWLMLLKSNINALVADANMLSQAAVEGKLATRADASKHQGDFRKIVQGVDDCLDAVIGPLNVAANYVDRISKGDIPAKITDSYNGDFNTLKNNLNVCIDAVNTLVADAAMLAKAGIEGKLGTRADASKHQGDFRKIVQGVDDTLDSVVGPLRDVGGVVSKMMEGDFNARITANYQGDFDVLKKDINSLGDSLHQTVDDVGTVLTEMANGDMTARIKADYKGDFSSIKNSINSLGDALDKVMVEISGSADSVAAGSNELSSTSEQLSQGATEQAAAAEQASSSTEQMVSNIRQNADNAHQTDGIASRSAQDAKIGGDSVSQTVEAMKKIANKISIIEEIARQTNLLALNAAIEAARAGEHGKGFAVVASEVRKLAERSQAAAGEINQLAGTSVEIAVKAGEMLAKLVPDIQKTAELVQEISSASAEQTTGVGQINKAIQQLDQVIQQNASASEQMSATSEELSSQAAKMKEALGFFKLSATHHNGEHAAKRPQTPRLAATPKKHLASAAKTSDVKEKPKGAYVVLDEPNHHTDDAEFEKY